MIPSAQEIMIFRKATRLGVLEAEKFLVSEPTELIDRILLAAEHSSDEHGSLLTDPIEKHPDYSATIKQVFEDERKQILEKEGEWQLGFCHLFWHNCKKRLKEEFDIDWYSPSELNPWCCFD